MFGFYEFNSLCSVYSVCEQSRGYFSASVWDVFRDLAFWLLYCVHCFFLVCLSVCLSLHIIVWIKITIRFTAWLSTVCRRSELVSSSYQSLVYSSRSLSAKHSVSVWFITLSKICRTIFVTITLCVAYKNARLTLLSQTWDYRDPFSPLQNTHFTFAHCQQVDISNGEKNIPLSYH